MHSKCLIKCLYGIFFFILLDSNEYQFWGITMIMHVYHVLIIFCVFYTLLPMSVCSCIAHASHMYTRCTIDAHTLTLDMFCIHSCQLSLWDLLAPITCSCVYVFLVYFHFRTFFCCSCLWTNLYLIKFVTIFVYGLCVCSFL